MSPVSSKLANQLTGIVLDLADNDLLEKSKRSEKSKGSGVFDFQIRGNETGS
jgi:hypothetical protein